MTAMLETASHMDIGAREEQQDRVAIYTRKDARLLVLADGLGGHEDGGLAAQAVIDVAQQRFESAFGTEPARLLTSIVREAHERIRGLGARRGGSPHSTCVLLHVDASAAVWAHVGDSRLYRFEQARLVERTLDHSVVELLRLQGRIDEEQMKRHPDQNRLFGALGGERVADVETGGAGVSVGDGFLLASDGVWENVSDGELEAVFEAKSLPGALERLVARAKRRGGAQCDNLAVAVVRHGWVAGSVIGRMRRSMRRRLGVIG